MYGNISSLRMTFKTRVREKKIKKSAACAYERSILAPLGVLENEQVLSSPGSVTFTDGSLILRKEDKKKLYQYI